MQRILSKLKKSHYERVLQDYENHVDVLENKKFGWRIYALNLGFYPLESREKITERVREHKNELESEVQALA